MSKYSFLNILLRGNDRLPRLAFVNDYVDHIERNFWSSPSKYLNKQVKMGSKKLFGPEINISTVAALVLYQILKKILT